jgi:hypothetical protein
MSPHKTYQGTSRTGNLQEALDAAVAAAEAAQPGADILINWRLGTVSGERGGIAGVNNVTVEIEMTR